MIKNGKMFGIINVVDLAIVLVVGLALAGLILVKAGRFTTSGSVIQKQANIEFDVITRGVKLSKDVNLFKKSEKAFITIRNVPYTKLEIVQSEMEKWQTPVYNPVNLNQVIAVEDPTAKHTYNFLVTLKDKATISEDGAVIGGNKIKIGLPVDIEGYKYRLSGVVADVRVLD